MSTTEYSLTKPYRKGYPHEIPIKVIVQGMGSAVVRLKPGDSLVEAAIAAIFEINPNELIKLASKLYANAGKKLIELEFDQANECLTVLLEGGTKE